MSTLTSGRGGPAVAMVLGSCVSVQVGAALAAQLFPRTGTVAATLLRLAVAAVLLLGLSRPRVRDWDRRQWRAVGALGLCLAGMNGLFYASISHIPLGTAVTVEFLGPLTLAAVLSRRPRDLAWVLLAAAGVALLGLAGGARDGAVLDRLGVALALAAGLFWALYVLAVRRVGGLVPGSGGLAVAIAVGAAVLLPAGLGGAAHALTSPHLALLALGTGLLASVVPYSLELAALRRLPARVFGVLLSLEPAVAAGAGWLLLAQRPGLATAVAVAVVVLASAGSTLTAREDPRPPGRSRGAPRSR